MWLDAIWLKRSWGGEVQNVCVLVAVEVDEDGYRDVLGVEETLRYMSFPREHWIRIRTTNPLERIMREIRRRTRVVGAFPDGNAAVLLVAARLRYIAGSRWGTKMYMNVRRVNGEEVAA